METSKKICIWDDGEWCMHDAVPNLMTRDKGNDYEVLTVPPQYQTWAQISDYVESLDEYRAPRTREKYDIPAPAEQPWWDLSSYNIAQKIHGNDSFSSYVVETTSDVVDAPSHYMVLPGVEAIDIMRGVLTDEEFRGYCKGCALKYLLRANKKHADQGVDLGKAAKYLSFLDSTEG